MGERVLVFTATYNEKDNIGEFCGTVLGLDPSFHMLVVDDNSPDGTGRMLDEMAVKDPRLHVIHRPSKLGVGSAHKVAIHYAIEHDYDSLVTLDADFSHDPADVPRLLEALREADFVVGSRYMKGGSCEYTGYRIIVSKLANWGARLLLGIRLHEVTTSYRAFRVSFLKRVDLEAITRRGYSYFMEVVHVLHGARARMGEVPIRFADRKAGSSKIPRMEILAGMSTLLQLAWDRVTGRAPTLK